MLLEFDRSIFTVDAKHFNPSCMIIQNNLKLTFNLSSNKTWELVSFASEILIIKHCAAT